MDWQTERSFKLGNENLNLSRNRVRLAGKVGGLPHYDLLDVFFFDDLTDFGKRFRAGGNYLFRESQDSALVACRQSDPFCPIINTKKFHVTHTSTDATFLV